MKRFAHILGHLLVLAIFLGAAWLLYHRLFDPKPLGMDLTLATIGEAVAAIPAWHVAVAAVLTVLNYLILVGYDWTAIRWVGEKDLPLRKIALASFTGYAFSYNFGATLFGTSIRYRLYSAWGVPLLRIVELLVILGLTFWFGLFALAGVVFIAAPFPIPPLPCNLDHWFPHTHWAGIVLLAAAIGYLGLSIWHHNSPLQVFGRRVPIPPPKLTFLQIGIACADLIVAAAVLYVLLPSVEGGYLRVLGVFMLAFVVAVLTHVPGGYGVFDVLILHFLPQHQEASVVAALIAFRVIWYWVPLIVAAVMLARNEWHLSRTPRAAALAERPPAGPE